MTATTPAALPRSPNEIVTRLRAVLEAKAEQFQIEGSRLLDALPFDAAREFLEPNVTEEAWERKNTTRLRTVDDVRKRMADYLEFAWAKANEARTMLSAHRSLAHFRGCAWLLGNNALVEDLEVDPETGPQFHAKPGLVAVSEFLGVDWAKLDSGKWYPPNGAPLTAAQALGR